MFKRNTAIFFILTAYIFLLAHAVIPHHHHDSNVCLINSHCETDSNEHDRNEHDRNENDRNENEHNSEEHDHEHHGESKTETCVLNQLVVLPSNHEKQNCKCFDCSDRDINQTQASLNESKINNYNTCSFSIIKCPKFTSAYSHYLSSGLSLRAPPVV